MVKINAKNTRIRVFSKISDIHHHFTHISFENLYLPRYVYARTYKFIIILDLKFGIASRLMLKRGRQNCMSHQITKKASIG